MSQVEIEVVPIEQTTTPKPKRGRPKKQVEASVEPTPQVETTPEPQVESTPEPVETTPEPQVATTPEPQVETVTEEPQVETTTEPSPQPEARNTVKVKKQVVKRAPRRKLATQKVEVTVEELQNVTPEETEEQVEEPTTPYVSLTNHIVHHLAQQRLTPKKVKSKKYKRLLQGNVYRFRDVMV